MSEDNIKMRIIKPEDAENVKQFLYRYFYPDIPLADKESEAKVTLCAAEVEDIHKCIDSGCSILAEETSSAGVVQTVGVTLAMPKKKSSIDKYFQPGADTVNTGYEQMLKKLAAIYRDARVFELYDVEELLYLFISSVASDRRGRNVAGRMTQELIKLGKSLNFKALTVDCFSFYCARVCERLGMECLNVVDYETYVDDEGKPVFKADPPHGMMKTYGLRL